MSQLDGVEVNGHPTQRYAGNMNLSFAYVEGESLIMGLKVTHAIHSPTFAAFEPHKKRRCLKKNLDFAISGE